MIQSFIIKDGIDIGSLLAAQKGFSEALNTSKSDLEKTGSIKLFEIVLELSWKTMKRILAARGKDLNSPKPIVREAALEKLISNPEIWLEYLDERNETVHTYNRNKAAEIFSSLRRFNNEVEVFVANLKKLKS